MEYKILIKTLRERLVMSQSEFAEFLGVSFTSVNRWENGHNEPTFKVKRKILKLCNDNGIKVK